MILDHVESGGSGRKRPRTAEPARGHSDSADDVPPAEVGAELTLTDRVRTGDFERTITVHSPG